MLGGTGISARETTTLEFACESFMDSNPALFLENNKGALWRQQHDLGQCNFLLALGEKNTASNCIDMADVSLASLLAGKGG